jgi:hypothetical protein
MNLNKLNMSNLTKRVIAGLLLTCATLLVWAQEPDEYAPIPWSEYQYPAEPEVLANLREWTDLRLKEWPQWLLDGKPSPTSRFTFATWHHWQKDDALLPSGLFGPVQLRQVKQLTVN